MSERKMRKDAEERRQIILAKAASLFTEHGIENVSMRQIAREAGVGQGTLYRSYTNKGALIWDLIGESCNQTVDKMHVFLDESKDICIRERLETVLMYHLESLEIHSHVLANIQSSTNDEPHKIPFYTAHYESVHSVILQLLNEISVVYKINILDPIFTADALMATMQPDVYIFLKQHRNYSAEDIRDKLFRLYIDPLFLKELK